MQARYRMYEIRSIEIGPRPVTPEVQDHIRRTAGNRELCIQTDNT